MLSALVVLVFLYNENIPRVSQHYQVFHYPGAHIFMSAQHNIQPHTHYNQIRYTALPMDLQKHKSFIHSCKGTLLTLFPPLTFRPSHGAHAE